ILYCQKDQLRLAHVIQYAPGIQQHLPAPDSFEFMLNLKIFKICFRRQYSLQQLPQAGNVPLAIAKVIEITTDSLLRLHKEICVKNAARRYDFHLTIQQEQ